MLDEVERTNTVVIGASAAGLATSACLKHEGVEHVLLEKTEVVGTAWRHHYRRLHLHTTKGLSALPFMPWPADAPRYPPREQVVAYLERYARVQGLAPRFGHEVTSVRRDGDGFEVETSQGSFAATNVVFATGYTRVPHVPSWPKMESFRGEIVHSSKYADGERWRGERVLVVGFGNSGGEIAIDLHEHGARPTISVRSRVNVVPRDFFGVPVLGVGIAMSVLPMRVADFLSKPLVRAFVGDIEKLGLRKLPYGPNTQIRRDGRIPLLDIGTIALIREGHITVRQGIESFTENGVRFVDGVTDEFAAVVLATGYQPKITDMLAGEDQVCDERGNPKKSGCAAAPGLYFCGFYVAPTGMLREIGIEARRIAAEIAA